MKLLTIILACVALSGCVQVISDKTEHGPRLKINTFLMRSGMESFHYDRYGILEVGKYTGVPSNVRVKFNQLTGQWEIFTESTK